MRDGDTLATIAQSLWGDSSLWYMLADANGMDGTETLVAGRDLIVPNKVANLHNTSSTYRVYDPNEAIGNNSPTATAPNPVTPHPTAQHKHNCGVFGAILTAVIAVAVSAVLPGVGTAIGSALGSAIGGSAGAVVGAAVGAGLQAGLVSAVSQGVDMAVGLQNKFSWSGVATAALTAGIGGVQFGKIGGSSFLGSAASGIANNVIVQGVEVATGLQSNFDWAGVAAAGIGAGVGGAVASHFNAPTTAAGAFGQRFSAGAAADIANAATRSVVAGTDFGDNILAALPQTIGQTVGGFFEDEISGTYDTRTAPGSDAAPQSGGSDMFTGGFNFQADPNDPAFAIPGFHTSSLSLNTASPLGVGDGGYITDAAAAQYQLDVQSRGTAYASYNLKQQIVQQLAAQASAASSASLTGYAAFDALDGKIDGTPDDGGWAASAFELAARRDGLASAYGPDSGHYDPNVYGAIQDSLAANSSLVQQWNATADAAVGEFLNDTVGLAGTTALSLVSEPINLAITGYQYAAGDISAPEAALAIIPGASGLARIEHGVSIAARAAESTVPSKLAQGLQFEASGVSRASTEAFLPGQSTQRLSVRAFNADGTLAEGRTVLDMAGYRLDNGELGALEFKLSPDAPYTARQQLHFPLLEQNGGVIVGAKGEAIGLPAGARIAPTAPVRVNGPTLPKPGEWWKF